MGLDTSKYLDISKDVIVKIKPSFATQNVEYDFVSYNKKIPNNDIIKFFKSNKLDKEYCFGLDGYKFKIKSINFSKGYIIYNIKYTENKIKFS